tara:strand:- start:575 stop:997 length:423 start_codon:yes stop_codon:yes gene_type:complete
VKPLDYATEHFQWKEFWCAKARLVQVSALTLHHLEKLETLRNQYGKPLIVTSGYRSPSHNKAVGGAPDSMHLKFATDIHASGVHDAAGTLDQLAALAEGLGFSGIGRYNTFLHLDCREFIGRAPARWDDRDSVPAPPPLS